jgi:hypothetical protein
VRGYSISSPLGAINAASITTPITGNYDEPPGGDGSVDPDDPWQITSIPGSPIQFAEASTGNGGSLADGQSVSLTTADGWIASPFEDLQLSITLGDGSVSPGAVVYTGNGGNAFDRSDLNADGVIDTADWPAFRDNHLTNLSGLSAVQAYVRGDLDLDGDNDVFDFRLFKSDYDAANGAGAFASHFGEVPEPTAFATMIAALPLLAGGWRNCRSHVRR